MEKEEKFAIAQQRFKKKNEKREKKIILGGLLRVLISILMLFLSLILFFDVKVVKGIGMEPGLKDGSLILVNKLSYLVRTPERGEIVLYDDGIGRVIGLPGDKIQISGGNIYINDTLCKENYLREYQITEDCFEKDMIEDEYMILKDYRINPPDIINKKSFLGKVIGSI